MTIYSPERVILRGGPADGRIVQSQGSMHIRMIMDAPCVDDDLRQWYDPAELAAAAVFAEYERTPEQVDGATVYVYREMRTL